MVSRGICLIMALLPPDAIEVIDGIISKVRICDSYTSNPPTFHI